MRISAIFSSAFWRPIFTLLTGSALAQLINLGLLPWLGHLYDAADFGVQGLFVAVVITALVGINGGYDQAVMLPEGESEARALQRLSQGIAILGAALVALLLLAVGPWFWPYFDAPVMLEGWQWLLPLSLLLEGWMQPLRLMLNRQEAYRALSLSRLAQAVASGSIMLWLGYEDWGAPGLLIGWVAGELAAWLWMTTAYRLNLNKTPIPIIPGQERQVAYSYRDFPQKAIGAGWLNALSRQLPLYLLPAFFGTTISGYYFMAQRVLLMPMGLASQAIGEVFYRQASQLANKGAELLRAFTLKTTRQLAILGLIPLVLVMGLGPTVVEWIFGEEWRMTGEFARWLMPWLYLRFITTPLTGLIDIFRRLGFQLTYNLALFFSRLISLVIAGYLLSPVPGIVLYSTVSALMIAWHLWFLLGLTGVDWKALIPKR